jgi:hypothetical protein
MIEGNHLPSFLLSTFVWYELIQMNEHHTTGLSQLLNEGG